MFTLFLYTITEMNNLLFDGAVGTTPCTTGYSKRNIKLHIHTRTHVHTHTHTHTH
jgi:hypothetical protein